MTTTTNGRAPASATAAAPRHFLDLSEFSGAEIRRMLDGVSEKVLAENLRQLEASGVVHREIYPEVPPRVEYSLTPLGEELNVALAPLEKWGERNRGQVLGRLAAVAS